MVTVFILTRRKAIRFRNEELTRMPRSALLTIDVQCDFTLKGAISKIQGTLHTIPHIQRLVRKYRESYHIFLVVRLYSADGSNAANEF